MENEFVPYEFALRLKALGFVEPCFAFYQEEYTEIKPTMVDDDEEYRLTGYRTCKNSEIPKHYTAAPTFSQVFRWFRKKYNMHPNINPVSNITLNGFTPNGKYSGTIDDVTINKELIATDTIALIPVCDGYEEAELVCLKKLIEIVENNLKK